MGSITVHNGLVELININTTQHRNQTQEKTALKLHSFKLVRSEILSRHFSVTYVGIWVAVCG